MLQGYRIHILDDGEVGGLAHYSGAVNEDTANLCRCPNCTRPMFPALDLDYGGTELSELEIWDGERFVVHFCPACFLYMEPYFLDQSDSAVKVIGGYRDGGEVVQDIDLPYTFRAAEITRIDDGKHPVDKCICDAYLCRTEGEGVYHQIGGYPFKGAADTLDCPKCNGVMKFAGILDYDDQNIPLFENRGSPVALIIGDYDCMNIFCCRRCAMIGLKWAH